MVVSEKRKGVIGERYTNVDALAKVTGRSQYSADVKTPGVLHGRILRSPHAHARITSIDASAALELPGVKAVVTGADFPSISTDAFVPMGEVEMGMYHMSKLMMARDKALFHGHPVAAVAATSREVAEEALGLIEVEYELLPPVNGPIQAMEPNASILHNDLFTRTLGGVSEKPSNVALHMELDRGDVEAGFREADVIKERTFTAHINHPGYIEPEADTAIVYPNGDIEAWPNTRGIFFHRNQMAILLDIPANRIKVNPTELGGAFGGKMYALIAPICVKLSEKSGRPVRILLDRDEVLKASPPAPEAVITVKMGAKKDGHITAIQGRLVYGAGAFPGAAVSAGVLVGFAPYKTPNLKIDGFDVVTNRPRVGSVRAPGAPPACFATESVADEVAEALKMDPLEFRLLNAVETGDPQPINLPFDKIGLREVIEQARSHPAWTSPLPQGTNQGRGVAVGFWPGGVNTSSCHVTVMGDGSVSLTVGSVDMSTTRTGFVQICADALGIPPEEVHVTTGNTETVGHTDTTGGSRITYTMGTAIHLACQELIQQMKKRAAQRLDLPPEEVEYADGVFHAGKELDKSITFKEIASLSVRSGGALMAYGSNPKLKSAPVFCLHIADVEVDPDTGKVAILKYTTFQDVGRVINPTLVEGQMQGGAAQALGWALTEEMLYDDQGLMRNPTLLDYRMPTSLDVPMIDAEIVEVPAEDGPLGTRGVGEGPAVPPPATVANAVYHATGVRMTHTPMDPERVFWALRDRGDGK